MDRILPAPRPGPQTGPHPCRVMRPGPHAGALGTTFGPSAPRAAARRADLRRQECAVGVVSHIKEASVEFDRELQPRFTRESLVTAPRHRVPEDEMLPQS